MTPLQVGLVLIVRDRVLHRLHTNQRWQRLFRWVNENALPLYLFHTTGMALVVAALFLVFGYLPPDQPTSEWWISRPLWLVAPAVATYPFLVAYRRITNRETATTTLEKV